VKAVFADTFYWVALTNSNDTRHHDAVAFDKVLTNTTIYTTDEVLVEFMTYPANLCPLSWWGEFAGLREDLGQPIGKAVEAVSRRAVRQGSAEHLDRMLSEEQRVNNTVQTGAGRNGWGFRVWGQMPRLRAGETKLAMQIIRSSLDVAHGHPWIGVAE